MSSEEEGEYHTHTESGVSFGCGMSTLLYQSPKSSIIEIIDMCWGVLSNSYKSE